MDDLKINNIKKKFIDTKEKFTYLFGLLIDDNLRKYTEDREISSLFEIDSTLDMLNISVSTVITNIEMFDNVGILSNNIMDNNNDNIMDYSDDSFNNTYNDFKTTSKSFFSNVNSSFNLDSKVNEEENYEKEKIKDAEEDDEVFNYMSTFVSSLGNNNKVPKVLLPMILYTYMKLDPESILNKEQKECTEQIPVNEEHNYDILKGKFKTNLNDENDSEDFNDDSDSDESVIGSGVEDLD